MTNEIRFIDLFCGIGSFHQAFRSLGGFNCVFACDIDKCARQTYFLNFGIEPGGDICKIEAKTVPDHDVLCAGFPCVSFSAIGKKEGFESNSGKLFFEILRVIDAKCPKIIVLENVMGLLSHSDGKTFERIRHELITRGYDVSYKILKSSDYGIPQMRRRLFIVASKQGEYNLKGIFNLQDYKQDNSLTNFFKDKIFEKKFAYTIRSGGYYSKIDDRHNWSNYRLKDKSVYRLTVKDCLKLQGFGDNFQVFGSKCNQLKQIGNTIPVNLTRMIGNQLKTLILS